jgi:effector-binding domain-containing protein
MSDRTEPADARRPRIEQRPALPYLAIWRHVTHGVPAAVDNAFPELFSWLSARGIAPAGPPLIRVREVDVDGEPLELEVAVPVAGDAPADERVRRDSLPAGRYVTKLHVGPYRSETEPDLGDARTALIQWMDEQGIAFDRASERGRAPACAVDHLRVSPGTETDYSKWETEIAYLILEREGEETR